jgi:hypothetical protein
VLGSCGDGRLQRYNCLYSPYVQLFVCVPILLYLRIQVMYAYEHTSKKERMCSCSHVRTYKEKLGSMASWLDVDVAH